MAAQSKKAAPAKAKAAASTKAKASAKAAPAVRAAKKPAAKAAAPKAEKPAAKSKAPGPPTFKPILNAKGEKVINLALQGGGAHGAFAWGVIDKFMEDGRIHVEGISGTSAGSMNAVVHAYGHLKGGKEGVREALHNFWLAISEAGSKYSPVKRNQFEQMFSGWNHDKSFASEIFKLVTHSFSPYQLNPMNFNPLRDVLEAEVDFEELERSQDTKLFLSTTNVRTGKVKVFHTPEITSDVVLASACLPYLFQAVEIDGEYYWDGGFMGNPVLYPLFYYTDARDVVILHINPIERPGPPTMSNDIFNRINEITFNSSLIKELRSVYFVQKLLDEGWIKDEHREKLKYVLIHSVRADTALSDLSVSSKFANEWSFLTMLRDRGRAYATEWLSRNFNDIGVRSTVNLQQEFL
ncbi:MAG: patatin-like phospholipase family protein [Betaproteobacteria bacterium]|nr:patatin-like phospholipase family protein [Betaproteobacteria bacterium]